MPNHFHGIIVITSNPVGADLCVCPDHCPDHDQPGAGQRGAHAGAPLPEIIQWFKEYIRGVKQSGWPPFRGRVWQRNYFEHIIRDEESLNRIREYIANNPLQWELDRENPNVRARHAVSLAKDEPWRI